MAHKGAAPAGGEIRTGQSGVTTVHLKTCQTEKHSTFDLASPEVGAKDVEERQFADTHFFPPTVNLISACRAISLLPVQR